MTIKVHFDGKVFVPDEPVDVPAGTEGEVDVRPAMVAPTPAADPKGKPYSLWDWLAENVIDDPSLPSDLSYQHDHYLYGTPKKP